MKNYNRNTKQYRFIQYDRETPEVKSITYYSEIEVSNFVKIGKNKYEFFNLEFIEKEYSPYFLWRLRWFFSNLLPKKNAKFKRYINANTNVIQAIVGISVLLLTILMIIIML